MSESIVKHDDPRRAEIMERYAVMLANPDTPPDELASVAVLVGRAHDIGTDRAKVLALADSIQRLREYGTPAAKKRAAGLRRKVDAMAERRQKLLADVADYQRDLAALRPLSQLADIRKAREGVKGETGSLYWKSAGLILGDDGPLEKNIRYGEGLDDDWRCLAKQCDELAL